MDHLEIKHLDLRLEPQTSGAIQLDMPSLKAPKLDALMDEIRQNDTTLSDCNQTVRLFVAPLAPDSRLVCGSQLVRPTSLDDLLLKEFSSMLHNCFFMIKKNLSAYLTVLTAS